MNAKKQSIYNDYLGHLSIKGLVKTTTELYAKEAKSLLEYVKDIEFITTPIVNKYLRRYAHLGNSGKNLHGSFLRVFLRYLSKNVYLDMKKIKIHYIRCGRKLPEILDQDEFIRRLGTVKHITDMSDDWMIKRNYALVMLLYATGMRVSEALSFNRSDINENDWVRIDSGKGLKDRYVPIAQEAIAALDEYIEVCPYSFDKGFFLNYKGASISRITAYKTLKKSMDLNPHSMRHHFATHMIINGADVSVVSELLGHSSLITTQIYTHIKKPQLAKTVNICHPMSEEYAHAE